MWIQLPKSQDSDHVSSTTSFPLLHLPVLPSWALGQEVQTKGHSENRPWTQHLEVLEWKDEGDSEKEPDPNSGKLASPSWGSTEKQLVKDAKSVGQPWPPEA